MIVADSGLEEMRTRKRRGPQEKELQQERPLDCMWEEAKGGRDLIGHPEKAGKRKGLG